MAFISGAADKVVASNWLRTANTRGTSITGLGVGGVGCAVGMADGLWNGPAERGRT
jgi:hypothetical protein